MTGKSLAAGPDLLLASGTIPGADIAGATSTDYGITGRYNSRFSYHKQHANSTNVRQ